MGSASLTHPTVFVAKSVGVRSANKMGFGAYGPSGVLGAEPLAFLCEPGEFLCEALVDRAFEVDGHGGGVGEGDPAPFGKFGVGVG